MSTFNYLYISPDFPTNFQNFIVELDRLGANVWAIGEDDFGNLPEHVRKCIKWFVKTNLYNEYDIENTVKYLINEHIKAPIDFVASHNEHWLRVEAIINEKFSIKGVNQKTIERLKKKSEMKKVFIENGINVAAGKVVRSIEEAIGFANEHKYPFILKPNEGVGAAGVYKVNRESELSAIWSNLCCEYIMEECLTGEMVTYDGIVDAQGDICFDNSVNYGCPIMENVQGKDTFFYTIREIPERLKELGKIMVKAFELKKQFFHFEFFREGNDYTPVEINARPPGGPIVDMMNFSIDDDLYREYASMVVHNKYSIKNNKKYYCAYFGRKDRNYLYNHDQIMQKYGDKIVYHYWNPPLFWQALGKYVYLFRSENEHEIHEIKDVLDQTTYPY